MGIFRILLETMSALIKLAIIAFVIGLAVGLVLGIRAGLAWDGDLAAFDAVMGRR